MLSRGAIGAPHDGHADVRGCVTVCWRGHRWIGTLANDPNTSPRIPAVAMATGTVISMADSSL